MPEAKVGEIRDRLRAICMGLPGVEERLSHGLPAWFVKKQFANLTDHHHGDDWIGLWAAAPPGAQLSYVQRDPDTFFVPPYVGGRGWIGMILDRDPDWDEVAEVVEDAYRAVAPARLIAELGA